tara:strand:+ start:225 stop:398 length:174 start_codon:yes stop_codon:yes gene_type:complete
VFVIQDHNETPVENDEKMNDDIDERSHPNVTTKAEVEPDEKWRYSKTKITDCQTSES